MRLSRFVGVLVAAVAVVALVLVYAPSASGQHAPAPERRARAMSILPGSGAEIGASVRNADSGVVVEDVRVGSPADQGGLKRGDVIVEFDGERVRSARQFSRLVSETAPNHTVKATVQRDGKRTDLTITPVERSAAMYIDSDRLRERIAEAEDAVANLPFDFDFPGWRTRLGVTVQEMTEQLASYFGAKRGVLVSSVADGSPASRAGLKAGDVITAIDGAPVATRRDLTRGLRDADGETTLTIVRDRKEMTLKANIEGPTRTTRR